MALGPLYASAAKTLVLRPTPQAILAKTGKPVEVQPHEKTVLCLGLS